MQPNAARHLVPRMRRWRSALLLSGGVAVVCLHAFLLWQRLDDRSIVRPEVAFRWIVAAALAFAAVLLRRTSAGARGWLVFWLIVAVLHLAGPAGAIWTESVLAAVPLLLILAAATTVRYGYARLPAAGVHGHVRAGVRSRVHERAPPPR